MRNEVFEHLQEARTELERSRKEACEGRQKAERDLFEASMKVWLLCFRKLLSSCLIIMLHVYPYPYL
jgi:hypothetical protein